MNKRIPNYLTLLRIVLILPYIVLLKFELNIIALIVFAIASITDFLDGYLARKYNVVSDFGKLMDPLADKILVMSAMIVFVSLGYIYDFFAIIILSREFLVTGIRIIASSKGVVIPAANSGKIKTVTQMIALIIIHLTGKHFSSNIIMIIPLFFTIWSGIEYTINSKGFFENNF